MALSQRAFVLAALSLSTALAARADEHLSAGLREEIVAVTRPGPIPLDLEATLFRPPGDGPFPLVVINHVDGGPGSRNLQARARYPILARELLARGYAVAVPERAGFAKSGGLAVAGGCNPQGAVEASVDDVDGAIASLGRRADIDARRVVVIGFGWGGLVSVAAATRGDPAVAGTINVEGFAVKDSCPTWSPGLVDAMAGFGKAAHVPSLWFYGADNQLLSDDTWRRMADAYTQAGAPMRLVTGDAYGHDARTAFANVPGIRAWLPEFDRFFRQLGLPFDVRHRVVIEEHETLPPAPSGFARVDDVAAVPGLDDTGRAAYAQFLVQPPPRAFALGPGGALSWLSNSPRAMQRALDKCEIAAHGKPCGLYAVDDVVVWQPATTASN